VTCHHDPLPRAGKSSVLLLIPHLLPLLSYRCVYCSVFPSVPQRPNHLTQLAKRGDQVLSNPLAEKHLYNAASIIQPKSCPLLAFRYNAMTSYILQVPTMPQ
jgi:hypothetical protein